MSKSISDMLEQIEAEVDADIEKNGLPTDEDLAAACDAMNESSPPCSPQ